MAKRTKMKEPVKPLEPATKCTGCNALSYQINHSNRRLTRLGEKLRRKGWRYGNARNKNMLAHNVAKGVAEVGKYAANGQNHTVGCEEGHQ